MANSDKDFCTQMTMELFVLFLLVMKDMSLDEIN
ncbi:MAG: hypothetical protein CM15mV71_410 [Caudoviricetes sp.]|nr:MAG: hypothetical protein CM15mV71_410 [Caudoviricetes sp.]